LTNLGEKIKKNGGSENCTKLRLTGFRRLWIFLQLSFNFILTGECTVPLEL
jgi:hypothetical protein